MTQFQTQPRNHQDKHFDQDSSVNKVFSLIWLGDLVFYPKCPSFKLVLEIIYTNILSKIHDDCFKTVTARVLTWFFFIWPGNLLFNPKWPTSELDLEIIKTNILSDSHDDNFKNVTSGVLTRFSFNLTW